MISPAERQRLLRDFHREPAWSLGVVLKCASCLVILMGICVIGATAETRSGAGDSARIESRPAQQRAVAVESRNRFDANRARLEAQSVTLQQAAR